MEPAVLAVSMFLSTFPWAQDRFHSSMIYWHGEHAMQSEGEVYVAHYRLLEIHRSLHQKNGRLVELHFYLPEGKNLRSDVWNRISDSDIFPGFYELRHRQGILVVWSDTEKIGETANTVDDLIILAIENRKNLNE